MTPKSFKTPQITSVTRGVSSEVPVKTSLFSHVRHSWLIIAVSLIAVGGSLGTVVFAVVAFVPGSTTLSTSTTTSTTTATTTTETMCFTIPSPRPANVWLSVGSMSTARVYHTATLISQDNSVLLTGEVNGVVSVSSVDKYIPSIDCFQSMRNMPRIRYMHTADQLPSLAAYVVIAGGNDGIGTNTGISFADLYHPITADILTIPLTLARYRHTSTVLSSSQLVLIGGYTTGNVIVNSSDMLDTSSNSTFVSGTNTLTYASVFHTATLLGNNSDIALLAGGYNGAYLSSTSLYQGSSNSFISLGSGVTMAPGRCYHTATYLPSPIDKVLVTGGADGATVFGTMFLFDVASFTFTTLTSTLNYPRFLHTATLLYNGKVLIVGSTYSFTTTPALNSCELIDPSNNYTATLAGNLTTARYLHTATLIPDNDNDTVLVCGGYIAFANLTPTNSCELYFV